MRNRGQSELVGFVLVFGIIVLTITVVTATGYVGLQNAQDHERANNAERSFVVLADNVDDVVTGGAPSRATEIKTADGTLSVAEPVTVTVTADGSVVHEAEIQPIAYELDSDSTIVYSGGAVVRESDGGQVMVREPDLLLSDEVVVVPIVRTTADGNQNLGGSTTALVRTERVGNETVYANENGTDLTINVTSPRAAAWKAYLEDEPATDGCSISGDTVTCDVTTRRAYVTVKRIVVRID